MYAVYLCVTLVEHSPGLAVLTWQHDNTFVRDHGFGAGGDFTWQLVG